MGGVDLADMRRLHCNSTIMGQNRWWLKLFFYLLDVGTSNALVLFNEAKRIRKEKKMNIVQFKMKLVEDLVGRNIDNLFDGGGVDLDQHTPVHVENNVRLRCAYCALMSRMRRTRYQCAGCGVPLCSIGNGKVEDDCFTIAHETEERLEMVCQKHVELKKRNRRQKQN
jgi:DDE_Tnp_1-like zinc-ribbon